MMTLILIGRLQKFDVLIIVLIRYLGLRPCVHFCFDTYSMTGNYRESLPDFSRYFVSFIRDT